VDGAGVADGEEEGEVEETERSDNEDDEREDDDTLARLLTPRLTLRTTRALALPSAPRPQIPLPASPALAPIDVTSSRLTPLLSPAPPK
jgi:hypothetical protein